MEIMTRTILIVLASFGISLGLSRPTEGQDQVPVKKFLTKNGERPGGLFAPGVMVGKTVYVAGKGDYRPGADVAGEGKKWPREGPQTPPGGRLRPKNRGQTFAYPPDPPTVPRFTKGHPGV